jgi:hypothetical protein
VLEDPLARDRYIEIQRDCIVPLLLDIVEVFRRSKHLLNDEGAMDFLGPMFAAVFDVQKDYTLQVWTGFYQFVAYSLQWCAKRLRTRCIIKAQR